MPVYKNQDNGTWYVSVYYKDWENNQSRKVKRGFKTKRDAQHARNSPWTKPERS